MIRFQTNFGDYTVKVSSFDSGKNLVQIHHKDLLHSITKNGVVSRPGVMPTFEVARLIKILQ